ncbi:hypothetical protein Micbo1qcDRAFT_44966 [Microdochium bolleyi]|uniref:Secreted protein n=1 Tax=Microdochium bolleyi TaxID=196109 RepID=A0A136JBP2_9PEZI|nr:hypothetical protein Micbo1qcDRAFT_44966 [Microdochium bolleyi]
MFGGRPHLVAGIMVLTLMRAHCLRAVHMTGGTKRITASNLGHRHRTGQSTASPISSLFSFRRWVFGCMETGVSRERHSLETAGTLTDYGASTVFMLVVLKPELYFILGLEQVPQGPSESRRKSLCNPEG